MDIKDLNNSQMILLTLLVSFVTSIATGIVTVTLLDQAPAPISRTINRVVERTIEKVVPSESGNTKVDTVIIKEEDLVVEAFNRGTKALVRIYAGDKPEEIDDTKFIGIGTTISEDGKVIVNSDLVSKEGSFVAKTDTGNYKIVFTSTKDALTLMKLDLPKDESGIQKKVSYVNYSDTTKLKVGQTVLAITNDPESVAPGIVTGTVSGNENTSSTVTISSVLSNKYMGSPILNTDAEIVGFVGTNGDSYNVIPTETIGSLQ